MVGENPIKEVLGHALCVAWNAARNEVRTCAAIAVDDGAVSLRSRYKLAKPCPKPHPASALCEPQVSAGGPSTTSAPAARGPTRLPCRAYCDPTLR